MSKLIGYPIDPKADLIGTVIELSQEDFKNLTGTEYPDGKIFKGVVTEVTSSRFRIDGVYQRICFIENTDKKSKISGMKSGEGVVLW